MEEVPTMIVKTCSQFIEYYFMPLEEF